LSFPSNSGLMMGCAFKQSFKRDMVPSQFVLE
jgi:hypothetical protein